MAFLYSMYSLGVYIFISVLGAVLILHQLKINGHHHGIRTVVWAFSAFFRLVFSFGIISRNSRSWESVSPKSVSPMNEFYLTSMCSFGLIHQHSL